MARWPRIALAGALAVVFPAAALAQTVDEPSFFESLWSSSSGAVDRIIPGGKDGGEGTATASPPTEATPGQPAVPSLSSARWIGFTPVIVAGEAAGGGAWIAGPFAGAGDTAWVTDTVSGMTVEVRLVWREAAAGSLAELSAEAAKGLGLLTGALPNVTIYLAR